MKANELRIGNIFNYGDRTAEVSSVYRTHFQCEEHETRISFGNSIQNNFKPIPLTEEWLCRFGFEKKTYKHLTLYFFSLKILSHGEIAFHPKEHGFNIDLGTTTGYQFGTTNIKQVHQLQNLYFALTGEELILQK